MRGEIEEEPEEEIEIEIPPYQDQERITEFRGDENQDHVTGFIEALPAEEIEVEDGEKEIEQPVEEMR